MGIPDHVAKPARCIIIAGPNGAGKTTFAREFLPRAVGRALRRAARRARETARKHGTPIYVSKDGKVVAIKP